MVFPHQNHQKIRRSDYLLRHFAKLCDEGRLDFVSVGAFFDAFKEGTLKDLPNLGMSPTTTPSRSPPDDDHVTLVSHQEVERDENPEEGGEEVEEARPDVCRHCGAVVEILSALAENSNALLNHPPQPPRVLAHLMPISHYRNFNFRSSDRSRLIDVPDAYSDAKADAVVPEDGERSRVVPRDDPLSLHWRGWVGTFIADNLNWSLRKPWHLEDFPKGYTLVRTSRKNNPSKRDPYLYGYGQKKRFRSPQEFGFHALWLYHRDYHDNYPCECTLCTGRPQELIESIWIGVPGRHRRDGDTPMPEEGGYATRSGLITARPTSWGTIKWAPLKRSLTDRESRFPIETLPNRVYDLTLIRPYREGELVWVAVDPIRPSRDEHAGEEEEIKLWPATVIAPPGRSRLSQTSVARSHVYNVELLGVDQRQVVPYEKVLCWRAYTLPDAIADQILSPTMPIGIVVTPTLLALRGYHPLPPPPRALDDRPPLVPGLGVRPVTEPREIPRTFENALGPLALAQRKADYIQERYCGTNTYSELKENLGDGSGEKVCYQGLWWGAERIWVDDLVRLTCLRGELENALEVAGLEHNLEDSSPEADLRQLFAHVREFTFEQVNRRICFSAELYELASDDNELDTSGVALARYRSLLPISENGLPLAPFGYRFRKLTPPEVLIYLPIILISGRYDRIPTESIPHRELISLNTVTIEKFNNKEFEPEDPIGKRIGVALSLSGLYVEHGSRVGPELLVDSDDGRSKILNDSDIYPKKVMYAHWVEAGRPQVAR
ncbi:hypothetical protein FRB96_007190 [Tulasnella sp. 330]|nr:hypothetical protein FRB96_007190 [Tulasnella sp. 330]KAG8881228.1 hypothetical protein FRB98_004459 [Tulasnella sp. 332]